MSIIKNIAGEFSTVGKGFKSFPKKARSFEARARRSKVYKYGMTFSRETIKGVAGDDYLGHEKRRH